jgi:hypothetical protein
VSPFAGQTAPLASGFFGGPQLVRGFAPNGFGPRDLTPGTTQDNVGGTRYANGDRGGTGFAVGRVSFRKTGVHFSRKCSKLGPIRASRAG